MKVAPDRIVRATFVVIDVETEEVVDRRYTTQAHVWIHNRGHMPEGFESALTDLEPGQNFEVEVEPERAYGTRNSQLVQKMRPETLPPGLTPGMVVTLEVPGMEGLAPPLVFHVQSVTDTLIRLDGNHPLAGKTLRFVGKVRGVYVPTDEELASGVVS